MSKSVLHMKSPGDRGFTLIELIVVILLISILMVFAAPRLDVSFFTDHERKLSAWILLTVKTLKENAVKTQTINTLHIDLDANRMWTSAGEVTDETPRENEYVLPSGYRLLDVEFPDMDKITRGAAAVQFYKKGYSDKALIHIEDDDDTRSSFLIEPFLPHVKISETYIEF